MPNSSNQVFEKAKPWNFPTVDEQLDPANQNNANGSTNALNRPRGTWKYEAPDPVEEVKPLTAKEIETIRETAFQEGLVSGHEEGYDKGHKAGFEKGQQEGIEAGTAQGFEKGMRDAQPNIEEKLSSLSTLIENIQNPLAKLDNEVKRELIALAMVLAKAVIKHEVNHKPEILLSAIADGIKTLPINQSQYQIYMNSEDVKMLTEQVGEQNIKEQNWQLVDAPDIARGGCRIQTINNAVDVSIERRSEQVFTQLLMAQGLVDDPRVS